MRQSRASSGVEERTALYGQRGKTTRGQRPTWSDDARRSPNPNSFNKDSLCLFTPHPYSHTQICRPSRVCAGRPGGHRPTLPFPSVRSGVGRACWGVTVGENLQMVGWGGQGVFSPNENGGCGIVLLAVIRHTQVLCVIQIPDYS